MKVKGDRDRRTGRGPGKKGGGKERAWITGQTGRREYTPFVCVCWAEERMKTQSISHLLYYPITFYARAHLHPTLISLFPSRSVLAFHSIPPGRVEPPLRG